MKDVGSSAAASPVLEPLHSFRDVLPHERHPLFVQKLALCCVTFDFTDPKKNVVEKKMKRETLSELVGYIESGAAKLSAADCKAIVKMLAENLFRPLPANPALGTSDTEEPAWAHLELVYEFFYCFVMSSATNPRVAEKCFDQDFISRLLDLFKAKDARERELLPSLLHHFCWTFVGTYPFVLEKIKNIFHCFVFESERHDGIAELLKFMAKVIDNPDLREGVTRLAHILIPLYKHKRLSMHHEGVFFCIRMTVWRIPELADVVISALLEQCPVTTWEEEVSFLRDLADILEITEAAEFQAALTPVLQRVGPLLSSSHDQVAEAALALLGNDRILGLMAPNRATILPIIFGALERHARSRSNVRLMAERVQEIFWEMDQQL